MYKFTTPPIPQSPSTIVNWLLDNWTVDELSSKSNSIFSPRLLLMIASGIIFVLLPHIITALFATNSTKICIFFITLLIIIIISTILLKKIKNYIKDICHFYKAQYMNSKNKRQITIRIKRTIKLLKIQKDELSICGIGLSILLTLIDTTIPIMFNDLLPNTPIIKPFTDKDFVYVMKLSLYVLFFLEIYPVYLFYSILSNELELILATPPQKRIYHKEKTATKTRTQLIPAGTAQMGNITITGNTTQTIYLSILPQQQHD